MLLSNFTFEGITALGKPYTVRKRSVRPDVRRAALLYFDGMYGSDSNVRYCLGSVRTAVQRETEALLGLRDAGACSVVARGALSTIQSNGRRLSNTDLDVEGLTGSCLFMKRRAA